MKNEKLFILSLLIFNYFFLKAQLSPRIIIDSNATGISEIITTDLNNDNFFDLIWSDALSIHLGNSINTFVKATSQVVDAKIYPNPFKDNVMIDVPKTCMVAIYNSLGEKIMDNILLKKAKIISYSTKIKNQIFIFFTLVINQSHL